MKFTRNERLLNHLFDHLSQIGDQPVVVGLANCTAHDSLAVSRALTSGKWVDVFYHFHEGSPPPSYGGSSTWDKISPGPGITRPDLIICNRAALGLITTCTMRRDLSVRSHLGLQVTLKCRAALRRFIVYRAPAAFAIMQSSFLSEDDKAQLFLSCSPDIQLRVEEL